MGFWIKPLSQKIADWVWLVTKLEKRLSNWSHRYLSRAGKLVFIKSVLEATPVFWMALAWIPRNVLARLRQLWSRYLWNGHQDKNIFAWVNWNKISLPKKWGGWGLKDLALFAHCKNGLDIIDRAKSMDYSVILQVHLASPNYGLGSHAKLV